MAHSCWGSMWGCRMTVNTGGSGACGRPENPASSDCSGSVHRSKGPAWGTPSWGSLQL